jgi:hypothetical protein
MQNPGWVLVVIGLVLVGAGLLWVFSPSIPWLGKLPGDIRFGGGNTRFYFPITTCILLSLVLTGVLWALRYFFR